MHLLLRGDGRGSADPFDPPAGSTASTWGTLAGDLAGAGRVIAYDRRGYTRSGGVVVRSAAEQTRDAAAVLDALQARPAVAVGTSAGATIALDLAVRRPDPVRADPVRAVVVHEAAWRALRHPDASGLGTLARMQWLAWRGRYPDAAETLLRWVYSYRDGGSAWDAFPEQWQQTARENGESVVADLKSSMAATPAPRTWRRSPHRSCAPTGRGAAPTCAPSRARWPRPSRPRACGRSTAARTPSHSTRRAPSPGSSPKRCAHRESRSGT
jgi:pimeloyl-ACP methyl ester carboxylesterase